VLLPRRAVQTNPATAPVASESPAVAPTPWRPSARWRSSKCPVLRRTGRSTVVLHLLHLHNDCEVCVRAQCSVIFAQEYKVRFVDVLSVGLHLHKNIK
jgi:hypothetical protein